MVEKRKSNGEFDLVTQDANGYIFYEAKFRKEPVTQKMINEEIAQVKKTGMHCYRYGFISRSGFSNVEKGGMILLDLSDLFAEQE
jgi:hypothetical protein